MIYSFGPFLLDADNCELLRDQAPVAVQPRVFDLIAYLVANRSRVVKKEELLKNVWGGVAVSDASLTQAIMLARRALEVPEGHEYIQTVRGRGYRLVGEVRSQGTIAPSPPSAAAPEGGDLFGREAEQKALGEASRALEGGRGGTVLFVGEPGGGKSRLLEEAARSVGARALWGRCYAASEGAPALWPWIQILRALAREGVEGLPVGPELRALVPELGPPGGAEPSQEAVDARFRLLDGAVQLLTGASSRGPLLLLLDDLHLADELSLTLLRWVSAAALRAPLLVVGTCRQDVGGALLPAVAALVREGQARVLRLRGLGAEAIEGWFRAALGREASPQEVATLLEQTSGNPFFLSLLLDRGHEGRLGPDELVAFVRNTGVREAIGKHLDALSAPARELLAVAAVLGPEFSLAPLCNAADIEPQAALVLLGEALGLGILAEVAGRSSRYRFVHALLRAALYERLGLGLRSELHRRVARALAALRERGGSVPLAEISHHFLQASPAGDTDEAVEYALRAAEEASAARLHEETVRLYERALSAMDAGRAEPSQRIEALLALGMATFRAGDVARAKALFEQGGSLARELGQGDKLARAALGYSLDDDLSSMDQRRAALLREGLAAVAGAEGAPRALLTGRLALAQSGESEQARRALAQQAVAMARASGDPAAIAYTLRCLHDVLLAPEHLHERCAIASEQIELTHQIHDAEGELRGLVGHIHGLLELGSLGDARLDIERHALLAAELRQPAHLAQAARYRAMLALLAGSLDEAERVVDELREPSPAGPTLHLLIALRAEQGRLPELVPLLRLEIARAPRRALRRATLALALLRQGDAAGAERELRQAADAVLGRDRDRDWLPSAALCAEVASGLPSPPPLDALLDALRPYLDRQVVFGLGAACGGSVALYAGLLARKLGHLDEARRMLAQATSHNRALGAKLFEARSLAVVEALPKAPAL